MPSASTALWNPKLLITVDTIVSLLSVPWFLKCLPRMNMILSPSTISPFSSTAIQRSPSPSKLNPRSAPVSFTKATNASGCVDPTPSLMLIPFGLSPIVWKSVSKSANRRVNIEAVAPFAPSSATLIPDNESTVFCRNWLYFNVPSKYSSTVPNASVEGRGNVSSSASNNASICASVSSVNLNPSEPKNLMPLSCAGLCDAEIITPATAPCMRVKYATPGVGMTPSCITSIPTESNPAIKACSNNWPEIRVSRPTNTRGCAFPSACCNKT